MKKPEQQKRFKYFTDLYNEFNPEVSVSNNAA